MVFVFLFFFINIIIIIIIEKTKLIIGVCGVPKDTSSINKASTSEYFPMFNDFVDKMDDRAQHGAHVARDVM